MIWAALAAFLRKQPPPIQAVVFGLCCGLFIAAGANSTDRNPAIGSIVLWAVAATAATGLGYYVGLTRTAESDSPAWIDLVYAIAWVGAIVAALLALFGEPGFKVAVLAIVPVVLLAPIAINGIRNLFGRVGI